MARVMELQSADDIATTHDGFESVGRSFVETAGKWGLQVSIPKD